MEIPDSLPELGLPYDVSHEVQAHNDRWDIDAHSHSWISLPDLLKEHKDMVRKSVLGIRYADVIADGLTSIINVFSKEEIEQPHFYRIIFWFDN